jgi:hypothetical protein
MDRYLTREPLSPDGVKPGADGIITALEGLSFPAQQPGGTP